MEQLGASEMLNEVCCLLIKENVSVKNDVE